MTANVGVAERADRLVAVLVDHRPRRARAAARGPVVVLAPARRREPGDRRPAGARGAPAGLRRALGSRQERARAVTTVLGLLAVHASAWAAGPRAAGAARVPAVLARSPRSPGCGRAAACASSRPTCARVVPDASAIGAQVADRARACTPTCATGATRSGCRTGRRERHPRHLPRGERRARRATALRRGARRRRWRCRTCGNWDHAGAWSTLALRPGHHGGRAAAAGGALRAVPALPAAPRDGDPAADRRRRPVRRPGPAAARRRLRAPAGRPRPDGHRRPGRPVRRDRPDGRRAGVARPRHRRRAVPGDDPLRAAARRARPPAGGSSCTFHPEVRAARAGERSEQWPR